MLRKVGNLARADSVEVDAAAQRLQSAGNAFQQGGLAGPVGADDRHQAALRQLEVEMMDRRVAVVAEVRLWSLIMVSGQCPEDGQPHDASHRAHDCETQRQRPASNVSGVRWRLVSALGAARVTMVGVVHGWRFLQSNCSQVPDLGALQPGAGAVHDELGAVHAVTVREGDRKGRRERVEAEQLSATVAVKVGVLVFRSGDHAEAPDPVVSRHAVRNALFDEPLEVAIEGDAVMRDALPAQRLADFVVAQRLLAGEQYIQHGDPRTGDPAAMRGYHVARGVGSERAVMFARLASANATV